MHFWLCRPNPRSRQVIILFTLLNNLVILVNQYDLWQILLMLILLWSICYCCLIHHQRLPIAISYHKTHWRCTHSDRIEHYELRHGFVVGPFALLKFYNLDARTELLTIGMLYWDIRRDSELAGNWNQFRTTLRYAQRVTQPENDIWLSG